MTDMIVTARLRANHEPDLVAMAEDPTAHMGLVLKDCIKAFFAGDRDFMVIARPRGGRCRARVVTVRCRLNWKKDAKCIEGLQAITKPAMKNKFYRRLLSHYVTVDETAYQNYIPEWPKADGGYSTHGGVETPRGQTSETHEKDVVSVEQAAGKPSVRTKAKVQTDQRKAVAGNTQKDKHAQRESAKVGTAKPNPASQSTEKASADQIQNAAQTGVLGAQPAAQQSKQPKQTEAASTVPDVGNTGFDPFAAFDDLF